MEINNSSNHTLGIFIPYNLQANCTLSQQPEDQQEFYRKYLLVNQCCNWQVVEAVSEDLPQPDTVPPLAFIIKPIDAVYGGTFVISPQQEKVLWILDLKTAHEQCQFHVNETFKFQI